MNARSRGEGLCLLGLVEGLQFPAHDVRGGAVVVDEVAARVRDMGEEAGDEVESLEGLGLLAVVAGRGRYVAVSEPGSQRRRARLTGLRRQ